MLFAASEERLPGFSVFLEFFSSFSFFFFWNLAWVEVIKMCAALFGFVR